MNVLQAGKPIDSRLSSPFRAVPRLIAYLLVTVAILPIQILAVLSGTKFKRYFPKFYHKLCAIIFGFKIRVHGNLAPKRPILYVSNHVSYMDITILGSLLDASFIAKAEVSKWPLYGQLARLTRTIFVHRRSSRVTEQRDHINQRLAGGDNLILFPEGTSADGVHVLPFKSALFSVVDGRDDTEALAIQPISIAYTHLDGIPIGRCLLPHFAWYGEMTMVTHLFTLLGLGRVTIDVKFHDPVSRKQFNGRKQMAQYCRQIVSAGASRPDYVRQFTPPFSHKNKDINIL